MSGASQGVQAGNHPRPAKVISPRQRRVLRIVAALLILISAAIALPLISLGRYHRTIADSLTRGLGHTVHLGSVNLTLFPLPGLVIHDLVVEENPAFGAEPLLRAPSVTVYPRLSSLWRQRLEISRIDLDNASVNLVRDSAGRWNFSSLLIQASRTAAAPTAQRRPGPTLRFPYIGFSAARINFKEGSEKKAFSFLNADASIWLADPNQWRIRLEAQPARTDLDLDLQDTGTIRLDGSVARAASLDQLPLNFHAEWNGAQLGQVSRLVLGSDSGWRGDLHADADITGDISSLVLRSHLSIADAHRIEFTPLNLLDIDARCNATYHHLQHSVDQLTCLLPTGEGHLLLTGPVRNLVHPQPSLSLEINHTPVSFAVTLLGLLRSGLPSLVNASGTINGQFAWAPPPVDAKAQKEQAAASENILTGHAVADTVAVHLSGIDRPFTFAALRFTTPFATPNLSQARRRVPHVSPLRRGSINSPDNILLLEPAAFNAGTAKFMQVSGQLTHAGFTLNFTGEGSIARLQPLAADFAQLQPLRGLSAKGIAQADLTFTAPWIPTFDPNTGADSPARIQGTARLLHAQLKPAWLPEPIEIATATADFGSDAITWTNARVSINGIAAKGSASYPLICAVPTRCPAQVNLDFPTLNAGALQSALLGAGRHGEFLEAILSRVESPAPPWPAISGTIHATTLTISALKLTNANASISVRDRRLNLLSLEAATLGGAAHVTGAILPTSNGPKYALNFTCTGVKLAAAASLFHENWGTGTVDGQMRLDLHGYSNLAATAAGEFRWTINGKWGGDWATNQTPDQTTDQTTGQTPGPTTDQTIPVLLNTAQSLSKSPLRARSKSARQSQWTAAGTIAHQTLTLKSGPAQGTIAFSRKLNLNWATWTGTKTTGTKTTGTKTTGTKTTGTKTTGTETAGTPAKFTPSHAATRSAPPLNITGTLSHPVFATNQSPLPAQTPLPAKE